MPATTTEAAVLLDVSAGARVIADARLEARAAATRPGTHPGTLTQLNARVAGMVDLLVALAGVTEDVVIELVDELVLARTEA